MKTKPFEAEWSNRQCVRTGASFMLSRLSEVTKQAENLLKATWVVMLLLWNSASMAQTQIGLDIDGEAAGDQSGSSVSMPDANTVAIGAPDNDGNGSSSGHVRIYSLPGGSSTSSSLTTITPNSSGCYECDSLSIGDFFLAGTDTMLVVNRTMLDSMVLGGYDVTKVCVSHIMDMTRLFYGKYTFNQDISSWDVSNVEDMYFMFGYCNAFNQDIGNWDVGKVRNMYQMFRGNSAFNQDLSGWDVSSVVDMMGLFRDASSFDQPIGTWDVSRVSNMWAMFDGASSFNQDLSSWDIAKVTSMGMMFQDASTFNKDLSGWDVSGVGEMRMMFNGASSFDQDLSAWCVEGIFKEPDGFASGSAMSTADKPSFGTCGSGSYDDADFKSVTFIIDMNNYTGSINDGVYLNGDEWGWCGTCNPMHDDDGDGVWTITVHTSADSIAYAFTVDGFSANEGSVLSGSCATTAHGFTNRYAVLTGDTILDGVYWGSCNGASGMNYTTFMLNMNHVSVDTSGVYILHDSFGAPGTTAMHDYDGDGIYSITARRYDNHYFFYSFSNGSYSDWRGKEHILGQPCAVGGWADRAYQTGTSDAHIRTCFAECSTDGNCTGIPYQEVIFHVDLTDYVGNFSNVYLSGSFNSWSSTHQFFDYDGDNIYTALMSFPPGQYQYKIQLDNWSIDDTLSPEYDSACTVTSYGYTNRVLNVVAGENQDLPVVTLGSCSPTLYPTVCIECDSLSIGDYFLAGTDTMVVVNRAMLDSMVAGGYDVTKVCVSHITDFSTLFYGRSSFNQDIGAWDVSNATRMDSMFYGASSFNQDIGSWDVSGVSSMNRMLWGTSVFNQDIGSWDVSSVTDMSVMFAGSAMNYDLNSWDVSSVVHMDWMFDWATQFNGDISSWDVSNVESMRWMFSNAHNFNGAIGSWDVSSVTNMEGMFYNAKVFDQAIGSWDVSSVTDMDYIFSLATSFNQPLDNWDVSNVQSMYYMFKGSNFNQNLNSWDVSSVADFTGMFKDNPFFNGNISSWNVSSARSLANMFEGATSFNQNIGSWNVSNVESLGSTFAGATSFNQDIGNWTLSSAYDLSQAFDSALVFNQDLSTWCMSSVANEPTLFAQNSALDTSYYPSWGGCSSTTPVGCSYDIVFIDTYGDGWQGNELWAISGSDTSKYTLWGGSQTAIRYYGAPSSMTSFVWKNLGAWPVENIFHILDSSGDTVYSSPTADLLGSDSLVYSNYCQITTLTTITPNSSGCYECESLSIGDLFLAGTDTMLVVNRTMLDSMVTGGYDVTKVCVSHITDMRNVFRGESSFNQDISSWDVSNVTNMNRMFKKATYFNQDISNWDVSGVNRMTEMFASATSFNQDLSDWCVTSFQYNPPTNFAQGSALLASHYPRWGNCPQDFMDVTSLASGAFIDSNGCVDCSALNIGDYFELGGDTMLVVDRSMLDSLVLLNDDLSKICVSHITDMTDALRGLQWFNTDISSWDVSNVTDMTNMFWKARIFNQDIGNWNVSNVTRMNRMFKVASVFNQDIGSWDVSNVKRFQEMFRNADAFNQDLGYWDVSNVLNDIQMQSMFRSADNFNQDLSNWCVTNISSQPTGFDANTTLTSSQLPVWGTCPAVQTQFITNPEDEIVNLSETDSGYFEVHCLDTSATYQWQVYTPVGWFNMAGNSTQYTGGQQKQLTIWGVGESYDGMEFRCLVSYSGTVDTTASAKLTVIGSSAMVGESKSFEDAIREFVGLSQYRAIDIPLSITPNPTTGIFELSPKIMGHYILTNSAGETIESGRTKEAYDLSNYPNGIYILRITSEDRSDQVRIVKQ